MVKLGIDLGLLPAVEARKVNELMLVTQPAHMQKLLGKNYNSPKRDTTRAKMIRDRLAK